MNILWLKSDFLHPTTKGGQIRTLEMLKRLHARHEVDYVAFQDESQPEGLQRAGEYSSRAFAIPHKPPSKTSPAFAAQLAAAALSPYPTAIYRWRSAAMRTKIEELRARQSYDRIVCDFLVPAVNFDDLSGVVLFQHNVETMIWRRHAEQAPDPVRRAYFGWEARKMERFERETCRACRQVVAVSEVDARQMQEMFGLEDVPWVPTGVDVGYFAKRNNAESPRSDLVFLGSMDWMPNIDGVRWFLEEIFPLIRKERPNCAVTIVGRNPGGAIRRLAEDTAGASVTGTVPDVRPYLWGARVSIVPLRIGGGTRLKIYESMAAGCATVSTAIGAEGLTIDPPNDIRIADDPEAFARECLNLLSDDDARRRTAAAALDLVRSQFSWESVTERFELAIAD